MGPSPPPVIDRGLAAGPITAAPHAVAQAPAVTGSAGRAEITSAAGRPVEPVDIRVPREDMAAPVVPIGTSSTGALQIPDDPATVGWWAAGGTPASGTGPTVLVGHIDSRTVSLGVMWVLTIVGIGDPIVLTGADGRTLTYRVTGRRSYPKSRLPLSLFTATTGDGLILITCGGTFDRSTQRYSQNIVVWASPTP